MPAIANAAALVSRAEAFAENSGINPSCVSDLCIGCGVPRRTLSHAFHQVLGMGPATYLRRLRLNQVRRTLRQFRATDRRTRVKSVALENGFWHPGRFSSQYRELFGESPLESARGKDAH
jgi:AraC family ethanolamine operon transcriptional activator